MCSKNTFYLSYEYMNKGVNLYSCSSTEYHYHIHLCQNLAKKYRLKLLGRSVDVNEAHPHFVATPRPVAAVYKLPKAINLLRHRVGNLGHIFLSVYSLIQATVVIRAYIRPKHTLDISRRKLTQLSYIRMQFSLTDNCCELTLYSVIYL